MNTYWNTPFVIDSPDAIDKFPLYEGGNEVALPISITNDEELANYAKSGTGTAFDPYILENYYVNASIHSKNALSIQSTTKTFVIRNSVFVDADGTTESGILMENVQYGTIENCTLIGNYLGIEVKDSKKPKT